MPDAPIKKKIATRKKVATKKAPVRKEPAAEAQPETRDFVVHAKQPRRYRAGREFTAEKRLVALTPEQYEAVEADPVLVVEEAEA